MSGSALGEPRRLRLAVHKFASCDGCQLQILNLEDDLLWLSRRIEIAHFPEASSRSLEGPYDLALVEGSITTPRDAERIRRVREQTRTLITIGACATAGGIQALRNWADVEEWKRQVYPEPRWLEVLPTSTPISAHVRVDDEIHGCPVSKEQVLRVLARALLGTTPDLPGHSVCLECKRQGNVCVVVARGLPCMGPVTKAGCGALCPHLGRDCYGCFGPCDDPNPEALADHFQELGVEPADLVHRFRGITGNHPAFRRVGDRKGEGR
ncbi:MAG TPA: oxidoreductase [Myxococcota bacterium]|nr:oxidoreductase [Myxococcota bacterium]